MHILWVLLEVLIAALIGLAYICGYVVGAVGTLLKKLD
jgi:hypothetical protein